MINERLREHATSIGFQLTLTKPMINHLVLIHHFKGDLETINNAGFERHPATWSWVTTVRCLENRGLIHWAVPVYSKTKKTLSSTPCIERWKPYRLTKAGTLVINLLKEAGIYQERLDDLLGSVQKGHYQHRGLHHILDWNKAREHGVGPMSSLREGHGD